MRQLRYVLFVMALVPLSDSLFAHGPAVKIDKEVAAADDAVLIQGEGLGSGAEIELRLQGILQDVALGRAQGDEHGRFRKEISLPGDLEPGEYTLIAKGEKTATAKLKVVRSAAAERVEDGLEIDGTGSGGPHTGMAAVRGAEETEATPEPMQLDRGMGTGETLFAWGTVILSAFLGLAFWGWGRGK